MCVSLVEKIGTIENKAEMLHNQKSFIRIYAYVGVPVYVCMYVN